MSLAPVVLTSGDPAGVGPEISELAWSILKETGRPFVFIGDCTHLPGTVPSQMISSLANAAEIFPDALPVLHRDFKSERRPGMPDKAHAASIIEVIETGVDLVRTGEAAALCTNPINKKALKDGADFAFPGHTEFLAELGGAKRAVMMLVGGGLRVIPTTIHIALRDVPASLTPDLIEDTIRITAHALNQDFGIDAPRLAVAGLNPHAGEGGAMGAEERDMLGPLLDQMEGAFTLVGPLSADTMFHEQARKTYDAAICMYHDQALIPIKTLAFDTGVNVTLGLPFVRTSPDHGTAFDIAGTGKASPASFVEALKLAHDFAAMRAK